MPEQIDIGGNSDKILAQMRKNGHGRHCIRREVEKVESINGHDCLKELRERGTEVVDEISTEESV